MRDGLALARKVGNRYWENAFCGQVYPFFAIGAWDELVEMVDQLPQEQWLEARQAFSSVLTSGVAAAAHRGRLDQAHGIVQMLDELTESADVQERSAIRAARPSCASSISGRTRRSASPSWRWRSSATMGVSQEYVKESYFVAGEAAFALGDLAKVEELVAMVEKLPPGNSSQFLQGHCLRFRARLAALRGDGGRGRASVQAGGRALPRAGRSVLSRRHRAQQGEWLVAQNRADDAGPFLEEAQQLFEGLQRRALAGTGRAGPRRLGGRLISTAFENALGSALPPPC